nr:hypothetical protein [Tanacetum cinerariifolium]
MCIKSPHASLVFATIMVTLKMVTYAIKIRELCSWIPSFVKEVSVADDEDFMVKYEEEEVKIYEDNDVASVVRVFDDIEQECGHEGLDTTKEDIGIDVNVDATTDSDPFGLDPLIKLRCGNVNEAKCYVTPNFPPGFTPNPSFNQKDSMSCTKSMDGTYKQLSGFSLLKCLEETTKVCGNSQFDFASTSARGVVLEKGIPDHHLIFLNLFWFFHSWVEMDGFQDLVVHTWNHDGIVESNGFMSFKKKLQNLKRVIRDWVASKRADEIMLKREHQTRLTLIDVKIYQGCASVEDFSIRRESTRIMDDLQSMENKDLAQKAKIKWPIEGDENTNHIKVKAKFYELFCTRFQQISENPPSLNVDMQNKISSTQGKFLELQFSLEEIKWVVWDCGGDRAPRPDGFSFKFIMTFWDLLKEDVVHFVHEFFHTCFIPKGCNSSFIALISKFSNARSRSLNHYPLCHLAILCHHPHAHDLKSLLTISPSTYALLLDRFDNNVSFEEEVVHQRLRKTLTHVLELSLCIYLDDEACGVLNFDSAGVRSLYLYPLCRLAILCHHPHARDLESLITISSSTYALPLDRFDNNVSFEEEPVYQILRKTLTHVLELSSCIYLDDQAWRVLNFDSAGVRL